MPRVGSARATPTLGVLITYHDEGALLRECLASFQAQDVPPDEVWVYDDASSIPTDAHLPQGLRVAVIRGETPRGPAAGRNALLQASRSDYVHFHDADDLVRPAWGRKVRQVIQDTGADVVLVEAVSPREYGGSGEPAMHLASLTADADLTRFCLQGAVLTGASVCRRVSALAIGGYRETLRQSEDFDYHVRLAASGIRWAVIPEALVVRRTRLSSYSSQAWPDVWVSLVEAARHLACELPPRYRPDLADAATRAGAHLFRLGARRDAREAFALAVTLGLPACRDRPWMYRWLARSAGLEFAESLAAAYRTVIPEGIRRWFRP